MSRTLLAVLLSSTMALGSIAPQFTAAFAAPVERSEAKNIPPLAPAGAAGIRRAQGAAGNELWIFGGFVAVVALLWILDSGGGDDHVPSVPITTGTTGTN